MAGRRGLIVVVLAAGCAAPAADPCARFVGQACVAVEVRGLDGEALDQLRVSSTALRIDQQTPEAPGEAVTTPIRFALLTGAAAGPFDLAVEGRFRGVTLGRGTATGFVVAPEHRAATVTLGAPAGLDLAGIDFQQAPTGAVDLAGADLAGVDVPPGSDLAVPPGSDLAGAGGDVPQLVAPLSGSTVTTPAPTLHWLNPLGPVHVDVCADRACAHPVDGFESAGTSQRVSMRFSPGWRFWRARYASQPNGPFSPTWQFWVNAARGSDPGVDGSSGVQLDANGDGRADLLVGGAPRVSVYVTLPSGQVPSTPTVLTQPTSDFGLALAPAGDVDGDGFGDVIVGSPAAAKAFVYYGGPGGVSASRFTELDGSAGSGFGSAVAAAGDFDGDGFGDVVIGACGLNGNCGNTAFVFRGSARGLRTDNAVVIVPPGGAPSGGFGQAVAGAGDFDGDGFGDLLVGAPSGARVFAYRGAAGGALAAPIVLSPPANSGNSNLGVSLAFADLNGDGFDDAVVGDSVQAGVAWFPGAFESGDPTPLSQQLRLVVPTDAHDGFGSALSGFGDFNGDGFDDVVVGASGSHAAFLVTNPNAAPITLAVPSGAAGFGQAGALVGDLDGDTLSELVIGCLSSHDAFVYAGVAAATPPSTVAHLTGPTGFGVPVAWRAPLTGDSRLAIVAGGFLANRPRQGPPARVPPRRARL